MKRLRWLLLVAVVAVAFVHYRSHAAPSAGEVESALRVYLSSPGAQNCSGSMTLEQLDEVRVGEYAEQLGGWPVYAAHRETCHEENRSSGYSSRYSQNIRKNDSLRGRSEEHTSELQSHSELVCRLLLEKK